MKLVVFESIITPDVVSPCYGDKFAVWIGDDKSDLLLHGWCRCAPNPFKPKTALGWRQAYGWISPGEYSGKLVQHESYGRCIIINEGNFIPARFPNVNHNDSNTLNGVYVHTGSEVNWPGSAGCITIHPEESADFWGLFTDGEQMQLCVADFSYIYKRGNGENI